MNRLWVKFGRTIRCDFLCPVRSLSNNDSNNSPFESTVKNGPENGNESKKNTKNTFNPLLDFHNSLKHCVGLIGVGFIVGFKLENAFNRSFSLNQLRRNHTLSCPFITKAGPIHPFLHHKSNKQLALLSSNDSSKVELEVDSISDIHLLEPNASQSSSSKSSPNSSNVPNTSSKFKEELSHLASAYADTLCNLIGVRLIETKQPEGLEYLRSNPNYATALFNLAVSYETGQYTGKKNDLPDPVLAFEYYQRSSDLGHDYATYNLSLYYLYGKYPAKRDVEKGIVLLEKAFSLGVPEASVCRKMRNFISG